MPYIEKNEAGKIIGVYSLPQKGKNLEYTKEAVEVHKGWRDLRREAFAAKEEAGELPADQQQNIDELWSLLGYLELSGQLELTKEASSYIRERQKVKDAAPKGA